MGESLSQDTTMMEDGRWRTMTRRAMDNDDDRAVVGAFGGVYLGLSHQSIHNNIVTQCKMDDNLLLVLVVVLLLVLLLPLLLLLLLLPSNNVDCCCCCCYYYYYCCCIFAPPLPIDDNDRRRALGEWAIRYSFDACHSNVNLSSPLYLLPYPFPSVDALPKFPPPQFDCCVLLLQCSSCVDVVLLVAE